MKIKNIKNVAFIKNLTKAYTEGIYADTPANRKLGRVGMTYAAYAEKVKEGKENKIEDNKDNYEEEYLKIIDKKKGIFNKDRLEEYKESKKYLDSVKDKLTKEEYKNFLNNLEEVAVSGEELKLIRTKNFRGREGKYERVPYKKSKYNYEKIKIQDYINNLEYERSKQKNESIEDRAWKEVNKLRDEQEDKEQKDRLLSLIKDGKYTDNPLNRALGIVGKEDKGIYYDLDIPDEKGKRKREPFYTDRFYEPTPHNDFIKKLARKINPNLNEKSPKYNDNLNQFKGIYDEMLSSYYFYGDCPYTIEDLKMPFVGHNSPKWKEWHLKYKKRREDIKNKQKKMYEEKSQKYKELREKLIKSFKNKK